LAEESASEAYEMHTALLSKGFALERPPSVHQVCCLHQDWKVEHYLILNRFMRKVWGTIRMKQQPKAYFFVETTLNSF
jgi:hypothetical protein